MRVSELISKLQTLQNELGDVNVVYEYGGRYPNGEDWSEQVHIYSAQRGCQFDVYPKPAPNEFVYCVVLEG